MRIKKRKRSVKILGLSCSYCAILKIDSFIDSKVFYAKFFYVLKVDKSNETEMAFGAIGCAFSDKSYRFMTI